MELEQCDNSRIHFLLLHAEPFVSYSRSASFRLAKHFVIIKAFTSVI